MIKDVMLYICETLEEISSMKRDSFLLLFNEFFFYIRLKK